METLNDLIYRKLSEMGYTGTLNDMMYQYYSDLDPNPGPNKDFQPAWFTWTGGNEEGPSEGSEVTLHLAPGWQPEGPFEVLLYVAADDESATYSEFPTFTITEGTTVPGDELMFVMGAFTARVTIQ